MWMKFSNVKGNLLNNMKIRKVFMIAFYGVTFNQIRNLLKSHS